MRTTLFRRLCLLGTLIALCVVVLGAWVLVNRLRGRRPFQRPDRVGSVEIAVFLLVPPVLPAVLHDDRLVDSVGIFVTNLVLLVLAYVVTSYGLLPMTRWGIRQLFEHLAAHGVVTETEASEMLGGPRALRRFAHQFEQHAARAPFTIRIDIVAGVKRYVREGTAP